MGGGGKPASVTQQTQVSEPPPEFKPYFLRLYPRAEAASQQVSGQPYGGPLLAGVDPLQQQALQMREQFAQGLPQDFGQGLMNLGQRTAAGEFLNAESNPYLQGAISAAARPIISDFTQRALPRLQSQAIESGAFDSSRNVLAQNALAGSTMQQIADMSSMMSMENLGRERMLQQQAPQLMEAGLRFGQFPAAMMGDIGAARRGFAQEGIEEQIRRFEEANIAPFRPLFPLLSILAGADIGQATSMFARGQAPPGMSPAASGIMGALGGAGLGGGLGSLLGPEGGNWGTYGAAGGGALGGLAGLLG